MKTERPTATTRPWLQGDIVPEGCNRTVEIAPIRESIGQGQYWFSEHAVKRMVSRGIERREVEEAVASGEIIEEYPEDKYSPSCLVLGRTNQGRNLHVLASSPPTVVVITVYEPDPEDWTDGRTRR